MMGHRWAGVWVALVLVVRWGWVRSTAQNAEEGGADPAETTAVTKYSLTVERRTIAYMATAGNLLITDDQDKANGSMFYVTCTEAKGRPVTFFYNGGAGGGDDLVGLRLSMCQVNIAC